MGGKGGRAGAVAALLCAFAGGERSRRGCDDRACAHGAAHLVGGQGAVIGSGQRQLAGGLDAIDEEQALMGGDDFGDFGDGLDDAGFVVGVLDGDKRRAGLEGCFERALTEQAAGIDGQADDVGPGGEHGHMLCGAGQHAGMGGDGQCQRLGAAAGEDDGFGQAIGKLCDPVPRGFEASAGPPAFAVQRRGVAGEHRCLGHGGAGLRPDRGCCGMVEVDAAFRCLFSHGVFIDEA